MGWRGSSLSWNQEPGWESDGRRGKEAGRTGSSHTVAWELPPKGPPQQTVLVEPRRQHSPIRAQLHMCSSCPLPSPNFK